MSQVRRAPQRASYERADLDAILDAGKVCHVAIDGPVVIPMAYARDGDSILLHGSTKSRLMQATASGARVCIAVTHLDGLVYAKSVFHHSMNYRSAVVFGRGAAITDVPGREHAMACLTEHLAPGRWDEARRPNEAELKATMVVRVAIEEFSVKARHGPPEEDPVDQDSPVWSGVLPLHQEWTDPRVPQTRQ